LKCGGRRIDLMGEHQLSGFIHAHPFLILKRAYGRQGAELVVQHGDAHSRILSEILHVKLGCAVFLRPGRPGLSGCLRSRFTIPDFSAGF
jgi:hypothetical protein